MNSAPFKFDTSDEPYSQHGATISVCMGTAGTQRLTVAMTVFGGPKGQAQASASVLWMVSRDKGYGKVDGTGFENAPFIADLGDYGPLCEVVYRRSNEIVQIDFPSMPGGTDTTSCQRVTLPLVKQLYALIG
ncbi:MAG TPA: hypothetical protein VJ914_35645 [Pseudonocardiaceae bacterium]|nr:hypothetical protein [Pseudonocardiaceae bacterium]